MTDHLGNVLATVMDRKTGHLPTPTSTSYDYWKPDIATATDYFAYGMMMPGRNLQAGDSNWYRNGYNGQMRDDEVYGKGALNTALFWEYDTRRAGRWTTDPRSTVGISPYAVYNGNPIKNSDPFGDTTFAFTQGGQHIGTLNDNLPNQVHFYANGRKEEVSRTINEANKKAIGERNSKAKDIRNISFAFIGTNSIADLRGLSIKSAKTGKYGKELGFYPEYTENNKEIRFKEFSTPSDDFVTQNGENPATSTTLPHLSIKKWHQINGGRPIWGFGHTHASDYYNCSACIPNIREKDNNFDQYSTPSGLNGNGEGDWQSVSKGILNIIAFPNGFSIFTEGGSILIIIISLKNRCHE